MAVTCLWYGTCYDWGAGISAPDQGNTNAAWAIIFRSAALNVCSSRSGKASVRAGQLREAGGALGVREHRLAKKARQNSNLAPGSDSIRTEQAHFTTGVPRMRSIRGANGPTRNAIQNQVRVDLPRSRAMRCARAIEASEATTSVHVHMRSISNTCLNLARNPRPTLSLREK